MPDSISDLYLGGQVLAEFGVSYRAAKDTLLAQRTDMVRRSSLGANDAEALRAIGIDLDEVLDRLEHSFGPEPLAAAQPPGPEGTRPRRSSLPRETRRAHDSGTGPLLMELLRDDHGTVAQTLTAMAIDPHDVRERCRAALTRRGI